VLTFLKGYMFGGFLWCQGRDWLSILETRKVQPRQIANGCGEHRHQMVHKDVESSEKTSEIRCYNTLSRRIEYLRGWLRQSSLRLER